MAETATQELPNKVTITDAGPSRKMVSIEIPAEAVDEKLKGAVDMLMGEAALPGFRKGKAPRWLVEKQFGSTMRKEAKNELVNAAMTKAIEQNNLKVLGTYPTDTLKNAEIASGKPLAFDVEVEVLPEFELPELSGLAIKKPIIPVTDEMVEDEVKKACINEGTLESRDVAEPGDYCTGHAVMTGKDAKEHYNLKGAVIQVPTADKAGKGMILGILVDDFAKQVGTLKPGDTATIKAKGPDNHEVEAIRGDSLIITFKVDRIDRIIPASPADLAASMGFEDEAGFRLHVRERLEQRVSVQQQTAMHQQVAKHLVDTVKMDLPERMTSNQAARTLERRRLELMYRGVEQMKIEEHMSELRKSSGDAAAFDLKLFFILHKASEKLSINVTEYEINQRIAVIAAQRNMRPDKLRQELIQSNQVSGIYTQIRDHKSLDAIVGMANVTEVPLDEYNKSMAKPGV